MNKRYLKVMIANLVDNTVGSVRRSNDRDWRKIQSDLGLEEDAARAAIDITCDVAEAKDWLFNNPSPAYELEIVRRFIYRRCMNGEEGRCLVVAPDELEAFIQELHKELVVQ